MKRINKLISIMLIIMLLFSHLVFMSVHAADGSQEGLSIEVFSSQLRDLVNRYWPGENKSESNINSLSTSSDYTLMNRLIIKTDSNEALSEDCGAIEKIEGYDNLHIMQYEDEVLSEFAYDFYCEQTYVEYVEYDFIFTAADYDVGDEISVYPYVYNIPWYQKVINSDVINTSISVSDLVLPEVVVAVVDSGLYINHELFESSRIIDSHVNYSNDGNSTDTSDNYGHGTHVTGIIYANTPENVKISPYKIANQNGVCDYAQLSLLLKLIYDNENNDIDIINMSLATPVIALTDEAKNKFKTLRDSVNAAVNAGITVIVSAGNNKGEAIGYAPGNSEQAITVSSIGLDLKASDFSNKNTYNDTYEVVSIAAPGENIYSSVPNNKYKVDSGTSMSAAFVSAAAAILLSLEPDLEPDDIENRLTITAKIPDGWDTVYGKGIVNFLGMINTDMITKPKPTIEQAVNGKISLTLSIGSVAGTRIYYTTNGKLPNNENRILYTTPIDISDPSVKAITAVALCDGKYASEYVSRTIWGYSRNIELQYRSDGKLTIPDGLTITSCVSDNTKVVTVDDYGNLHTKKQGATTIHVTLSTGTIIDFNVTVNYIWWQWLIIIFLFGWIWY